MAISGDKSPLVVNIEENEAEQRFERKSTGPQEVVRNLYLQEQGLGIPCKLVNESGDTINISASNSVCDLTEQDSIVAIFVVAFDTRSGNLIEWCLPADVDLTGVEFKAMASGSHTVKTDFIYFKKGDLYGLSCFENMPVDSAVERGARMKSVGILATSYTVLYRHMQFLEKQVRHQLEHPGRYEQLTAFYNDRRCPVQSSPSDGPSPGSTPGAEDLPNMKITHPAGCFQQFINFFGEQIFVLWKIVLLQKRVLFFSPPPIGVVCYRVYCCCCLGNHTVSEISGNELNPLFYVNVEDIDVIQDEPFYIACTTEKIFEEKRNIYDVYVDNQLVKTEHQHLSELTKINNADRDKFNILANHRSSQHFTGEVSGKQRLDDEQVFIAFFTEQNNKLFQTLLDVSSCQDKELTSDHIRSMGLDPVADRQFIMDLVELYGIDVILMVDNPCCPV